jgi:hypothetical protein
VQQRKTAQRLSCPENRQSNVTSVINVTDENLIPEKGRPAWFLLWFLE